MTRKLIVITIVATILLIAGIPAITVALTELGLVGIAQHLLTEYLTGTAITISAVLLILGVPELWIVIVMQKARTRCLVCDRKLQPGARYCPICGCRAT